MNDFLYFCPTCRTIYEIVRHRIRPPAEPICWRCRQDLPIADEGDWLTYQQMRPRFERIEEGCLPAVFPPPWVKVKNPNAPAVKRESEEDWAK
jgi:hypothetical protein